MDKLVPQCADCFHWEPERGNRANDPTGICYLKPPQLLILRNNRQFEGGQDTVQTAFPITNRSARCAEWKPLNNN